MAKKLNDTLSQPGLFKAKIPQMPEGYYSGDKPNHNLPIFVEQHIKEQPYDLETDDYDIRPLKSLIRLLQKLRILSETNCAVPRLPFAGSRTRRRN